MYLLCVLCKNCQYAFKFYSKIIDDMEYSCYCQWFDYITRQNPPQLDLIGKSSVIEAQPNKKKVSVTDSSVAALQPNSRRVHLTSYPDPYCFDDIRKQTYSIIGRSGGRGRDPVQSQYLYDESQTSY